MNQDLGISKGCLWVWRIIMMLLVLFLAFDGIIHVLVIPPVAAAFIQLGFPLGLSVPIGIIELVCLVLYCLPRTAVLGALLLTGDLGGAVLTNLRAGLPLFGNVLFPVYVGILLWGTLYILDPRIRALLPLRKVQ
ncbi:MAG: Arginine/ornithine antiporter ArcD [Candidatus Nomurabacteria bacterium]|nr:Arginine/ornithine antiporter ArcD [Candidatus Nomurabacteria bacterium]